MDKKVLEIGILYLGLHNQLIKKYGINRIITNKEFFCKVGKHGQIPKPLRWLVIKEMSEKKLIERVNRDKIKILEFQVDIENKINELFNVAGLY